MRANKIRDLIRDSYCEDEDVIVELEELERLSKIGRAFEKAKNEDFGMFVWMVCGGRKRWHPISQEEYDRVIEWYEREEDCEK